MAGIKIAGYERKAASSSLLIHPDDFEPNNILSVYTNNDRNTQDIENIMMSSLINTDVELPFSIRASETCIIILLQNGFFNFLNFNVKRFIMFFYNILFITLFKLGGDNTNIINSPMFLQFLRLASRVGK